MNYLKSTNNKKDLTAFTFEMYKAYLTFKCLKEQQYFYAMRILSLNADIILNKNLQLFQIKINSTTFSMYELVCRWSVSGSNMMFIYCLVLQTVKSDKKDSTDFMENLL